MRFGSGSSSDSTFRLVFLSVDFFFVAITHTNIWSACWTIQNNGIQQQTGGFPWSPATPGFVSFCFQVHVTMADGFYFPNGLDCNMTSLETVFVIFADSLSVPMWLLKRQDIYVPAGVLGMAEAGFRALEALNKLSVVFSVAPAGQCCFKFWRFTHSETVPHCALAGGSGKGRGKSPSSGSCWAFAGSNSTFPMPRDTALFSMDSKSHVCKLPHMPLHISPAFVFRSGCTLLGATFDLSRVLEIISFGASLSPWTGGRDHQQILISFESGCSWSKNKKAFTKY